jgi:hypothetical protein
MTVGYDSQISLAGTIFMDRLRVPSYMSGVAEACLTGMAVVGSDANFRYLECVDEVDSFVDGGLKTAEVCSVSTI